MKRHVFYSYDLAARRLAVLAVTGILVLAVWVGGLCFACRHVEQQLEERSYQASIYQERAQTAEQHEQALNDFVQSHAIRQDGTWYVIKRENKR